MQRLEEPNSSRPKEIKLKKNKQQTKKINTWGDKNVGMFENLKKFLDGHSHPQSQCWTAYGSIYHKLEVTSHGAV